MKRVRWFRIGLILLMLVGMTFVSSEARADAAPPHQPPGSDLVPMGEVTNVRMVAETVVISALRSTPAGSQGQAAVQATFSLMNTGTSEENMTVGFPLAWDDGYGRYPEISDFRVRVNDTLVPFERVEAPNEFDWYGGQDVPWALFPVTFPPGENILMQVEYTLEGSGYSVEPYVEFGYVLKSGAGWFGTIGSADIIVRLPFDASEFNSLLDFTSDGVYSSPIIEGSEIHWRFENFEPDESYNLDFRIVKPDLWWQVLIEQGNLENNPKDGEAWGRLGKAYKTTLGYSTDVSCKFIRFDQGADQVYQLAKQAYERSVALLPEDPSWHAGFAELLLIHSYFCPFGPDIDPGETALALQELQRAFEIDPQNAKALELAELLNGSGWIQKTDGGYVFLTLTAAPVPSSTPIPVSTPRPTVTSIAVKPNSQKPSLCGAAFLPLILVGAFWLKKRANRA